MVRKLAAVFLLSFFIVAFVAATAAIGSDKPVMGFKDRASIPARYAPIYSFPGVNGTEYTAPAGPPEKAVLRGGMRAGTVTQLGSTTYDYQHNCTMGRQVEHRRDYSDPYTAYGWYIHFDWMAQTHDTLGQNRGIGYQAYDISACDFLFEPQPGGIRIEPSYSGYVTLDADNIDYNNSWAIPGAHVNDDGVYSASALWDFVTGGPVFGVFTNDFPEDRYGWWQNSGTGTGNENIWPKFDWDIDGAQQVLHMVTSESGGAAGDPQTFSYYRRVGGYGTGVGTWSTQRLIDTAMNINVTVASSPVSDKVAIVWNAPTDYWRSQGPTLEFNNQYENDIWFAISDTNGADWDIGTPGPSIANSLGIAPGGGYNVNTGGNLTSYDSLDTYKAYCDISALWYIDEFGDDWLQIAWGCRQWGVDDPANITLYRRSGIIFHWNQFTDVIRTVMKADWDEGGTCYGHAWGTDVAKMTLSECDGKLYCSYTQFGDKDHPCDWYDAVNNVISGYLYMSVYDPAYDAWDRGQRVTSIPENATGCTPGDMSGPGDCNSEYWASMARYGRADSCLGDSTDVLDLIYVNDYAPGGCVQTESGVWTVNPVNWVVYQCREAVPEPGYSDDAGPGYGLCAGQAALVIGTTDDTTFVLTLENPGILANNFTAETFVDSSNGASNGSNTTIGVSDASGIIDPKGGTFEITVSISTSGEDNYSTVYGHIVIDHDADEGEPREIPVCIMVIDDWSPLEHVTLNTACKNLRVYNNGQMSNNTSNESMDFTTDDDDCANIYLYDGSPIICRDDGGTKQCFFATYDNDYASDHALRQVSPMYYDSSSNTDYQYASAEFVTADSAIGLIVEYFAPKDPANCCFIIQKLKYWNLTEVSINNIGFGEALDWDVPVYDSVHAASDNESDFDATRELIYQYGCYQDPCDTLQPNRRFAGIAAYKDKPFKNYQTLENDVYVYTSGPFGNDAPLPDDTMYGLMAGVDGFHTASLDSCEDLMTLVTFDFYSELVPNDTQCFIKILTTSTVDAGGAQLTQNVDNANTFIDNHEEIQCPVTEEPCDCLPGDANNDAQQNVGDAVYLINFVFKQGPAPIPYATCSGDANGDCQANVGDAVYLINYVFKQGPPPPDCLQWRDGDQTFQGCGSPIVK
jgi:hypothetical protein